jgi:N-acetylglucosaminyldiphosphoundecaprenol N-acetyl-beta-D-mannosaminyltransferase
VLNSADLSLIDGFGILVALEYLKKRGSTSQALLPGLMLFARTALELVLLKKPVAFERLSGVDLIWLLVQQDFMKGRKVYLLGGRDHVSSQAANRLNQYNPTIQFRSSNGLANVRVSDPIQDRKIVDDINEFGADVLLVAYGHPWQDLWIAEHSRELHCRMAVGVGGAFDYISGRVSRAPGWMRANGLEWLYRLLRQPGRYLRIYRALFVYARVVITRSS